jgi:hypothetical protein
MQRKLIFSAGFAVIGLLALRLNYGAARSQTPTETWVTFTDAKRHFHFEHPAEWQTNNEIFRVAHYRLVFAALNSMGTRGFTVAEQGTSSTTFEYNSTTIANQLPNGAVYMDVGWWEGPPGPPRWGPNYQEMDAADLSTLLPLTVDHDDAGVGSRQIEFNKWGRRWSIEVYMRDPVSQQQRQAMNRVLASFRFDGVPSGDEIWAIGEARKRLPPEAHAEEFVREGGNGFHNVITRKAGTSVIVTFTTQDPGQAKGVWEFRVTDSGMIVEINQDPK